MTSALPLQTTAVVHGQACRHKNIAFANVIGRCKLHDAIDSVPLFEHMLCVNYLFLLLTITWYC